MLASSGTLPAVTTTTPSAEPTSGLRPSWTAARALAVASIVVPTLIILIVASGLIEPRWGQPGLPFAIDWPPPLFEANTPTGGDMGAHVMLPKIVAEELLPTGRIMGWSNDWYAGFPVLYFYFPLPTLAIVLLDVLLPYGVAFKLVTIAGLLALPAATYYFTRSLGYGRLVAAMATIAGSAYVFMESFAIFGANIKSTMAGEFSFGWGFAFMLLYLGTVIRDVRRGQGLRLRSMVLLGLTALSHIVPVIIAVIATIPLLLRRSGPRIVTASWVGGLAVSAFWALPFLANFFSDLTSDMNWSPLTEMLGEGRAPGVASTPLPDEFIPVLALGLIGVVWTLLRRDDVVPLIWVSALSFVAYRLIPEFESATILYNGRLLPFWFFGLFVFAGLAAGLAVVAVSRWLPYRRENRAIAGALAGVLMVGATVVAIHDSPGWIRYNFTGYEGKPGFAEYEALLETVDQLPPGRVMWEASSDLNKYGTTMALMLLPYWTGDHPSMEGLYFESSVTTPFHFLNASEVSAGPSNPVRGLAYRSLDFDRAIAHLELYDVRYYISISERATDLARLNPSLTEVAQSEPFTVFELPQSELVDPAAYQPVVWDGGGEFLDAALDWYDDIDNLDKWVAADGPPNWPRVTDLAELEVVATPIDLDESAPVVTDVVLDGHHIEFTTTAIGVPHLVKVSYFPNWVATGADGPYRVAPALMLVVPTQSEVELNFGRTGAEVLGMGLSGLSVIALAAAGLFRLRRRPEPEDSPQGEE